LREPIIQQPPYAKFARRNADQLIRVMGSEDNPYYTSGFFMDLIRERAYNSEYEIEELNGLGGGEETTNIK